MLPKLEAVFAKQFGWATVLLAEENVPFSSVSRDTTWPVVVPLKVADADTPIIDEYRSWLVAAPVALRVTTP
jgi:hypothetical protein